MLQKIIDSDNIKHFDGCTLKKTRVYLKKRCWEIILESPHYIDISILEEVEDSLKERIQYLKEIRIFIEYSLSKDWFYNNFEIAWKDIYYSIQKTGSSWSRCLSSCRPELDRGNIKLHISNPMIADLFNTHKVCKYIEEVIKERFKIGCNVILVIDEEKLEVYHQEYSEKKEQEDSSLIMEVINGIEEKQSSNAIKSNTKQITKQKVVLGRAFKGYPMPIDQLREDSGRVIVKGQIFDVDIRETRNGKIIYSMDITDYNSSITIKAFCEKAQADKISNQVTKGDWVLVRGECLYDKYQRDVVIFFNDLMITDGSERQDNAQIKRVELHLHTQMSTMDGVSSVSSLVSRAAKWGHPAIAITDHGVLQAFPDAYRAGRKHGIKILYGLEAYLINDCRPLIINGNNLDFNQPIVVFDIETTGLDPNKDTITEIGAVKIINKKIVDSFQTFVNPEVPIPAKITKLTGINDDMVKDAPLIGQALEKFKEFCGNDALAAHNAPFDLGFIKEKSKSIGWEINNPVIDTLILSRELIQNIKRHKLDHLAKYFGIQLENHHRAHDDAAATGQILLRLFEILEDMGIQRLIDINSAFTHITNLNSLPSYHATILVKNKTGLKNLYKLVSKSHIDFFYRRPRIPKSILMQYREGLIIGSGCEAGELYKAMVKGSPYEEVKEIAQFYDFLEVQPTANNAYLIREGYVENIEGLQKINKSIIKLGKRIGKPVVATGDVHFLDPHDEYFRRILMSGQGYSDADYQPPLYFKTTEEMLNDFSYLDKETAFDIVVHTPRQIAESIDNIQPIPDGLFTPEIPEADEQIKQMTLEKAYRIYGDPLPDIVWKRLEKELDSIIKHGFSVLYFIAHKLVKKSLNDGYLVGSRGSVGSSLVAYMTDITEVNPLPPHYVCPQCKHSDFDFDKSKYGVGIDLPDKNCPRCGFAYNKDGFDIPFEVFLGFKGDKVPDIDLNFSGEYQPTAHKYAEELFGEGYVFRAGTIGTIAEKTAFGFVKKYLDEKGITVSNAEINRLVTGCTGVKRTTGQHPGGLMVVPRSREIFEFTPIQYPADDKDSGVITTHFDYNFIHDNLVKLDILGHDDPTMIRMLEDITGMDAKNIPLDDDKTMGIFSSTEPLGVNPEDIGSKVGTFGIPEFGTRFVRQMLVDTKPTTFSELVRISGLSHGTDVWLNNAQELIRDGIAQLSEVISTRDDIMIYLIYKGLEPTLAFQIMESVRKGKGLIPEYEQAMVENHVPDWFISSCKKIKYMFPKAHAAAYVLMAFRIAYFKVYHPHAFYATYFTIKSSDFDADMVLEGKDEVMDRIRELESKGNSATAKEKSLLTVLEVVLEMYCRNISFLPVNLYQSHPTKFLIVDEYIRPPLNTLQGVGVNAALSIAQAREQGEFISLEDLRERTKITKTAIEVLKKHGALEGIPETSQLSLF